MGEGKNLVGVDIGASGVKVCQVRESRKGLGLVRLGFVPLSSQAIVDGQCGGPLFLFFQGVIFSPQEVAVKEKGRDRAEANRE